VAHGLRLSPTNRSARLGTAPAMGPRYGSIQMLEPRKPLALKFRVRVSDK
jgi:hypothetical protein